MRISMKKHLMIALAAVVFSGLLLSCSKDVEVSGGSSTEIDILKTYEDAFLARFGQPAESQSWGFGSAVASTRVENANANEWADPDKEYGGLKVPPPLTANQIAVVKKYFQTVKNPTYQDPQWTNYFIQQVYKGYTDPMEGYSPEAYLAADGHTYIKASDNMDHLAAIDGDFVDHINNFNHGDCSTNGTVLDNGGNANSGPFHSDKIMYMKESTTKSFGYYNSNGSVCRTEYTGLVGFQTIIDALGAEAECLNDGWNRSFMGFDFEQMVGPEILSNEVFEWNGNQYPVLSSNQNMYCGTPLDCDDTDLQKDGYVDNLLAQGYLPVQGGANKKWVKVGGCADGYYSDWIVTLTEAKPGNTPPEGFVCRIIAEDLTVGEASDFDFNDVVFDVLQSGTIIIRAIGGELPLYIEGNEVHAVCGISLPASAWSAMKNTGWNPSSSYKVNTYIDYTAELGRIELGGSYNSKEDAKRIRIWVTKRGENIELKADQGKVASKVAVGADYRWCAERQDIDAKFHKADGTKLFQQYVIGKLGDDWENGTAWYQQLGK